MAMQDNIQDVIELGSSDEETEPREPVLKKRKIVNIPMVQIPEIIIKPTKPNTVAKIGDGITVTKVVGVGTKVANPFATKTKQNGKPTLKVVQPSGIKCALPAALMPPSVTITPAKKKTINTLIPIKFAKGAIAGSVMRSKFPTTTIPSGITVKKNNQLVRPIMRRNPITNMTSKKRPVPSNRPRFPTMVCVDLDDDDASQPRSGPPQWYLRPEELENKNNASESINADKNNDSGCSLNANDGESNKEESKKEDQNNKEPAELIEITIEDSPSKPQKIIKPWNTSDLAITIEDSPTKPVLDKPSSKSSDNDDTTTDKKSKKKLEYPQGDNLSIEIELTPVDNKDEENVEKHDANTEIVEIEESPLKPLVGHITSTPKKKPLTVQPQLQFNINNSPVKSKSTDEPSTPEEFNSTYQSFIDLCFKLENTDDMNKIVEKKIKAYYRQVPKEYTESEEFIDMVASKISSMKSAPEKMYLYIKDIVDELNMQRKLAKSQPAQLDVITEAPEKVLYGEQSEFDSKRQRQIKKLEKTLKKLHRAIQKLEEQEVDFDDEEDSVYILTERYKERMIKVHAKFCQLTNTKMPSEPKVHIDARPGQPQGPAKRLEKWINKKVPIGTPLPFPDFHDVLRCVRDANQEEKLGWNEADIMEEARDLFTRCGKKLQRRRQENEWRLAVSRIQSELDPAEGSEELQKKLDTNQRVASVKEREVLKKYADRQNQLKLEAVEIGDKEADESPVDTDDEEPESEDKISLETKKKRTERLKRLLQEKSKRSVEEKKDATVTNKTNVENEKTQTIEDSENVLSNIDIEMVSENNEKDLTENNKQDLTENKDKDSTDNSKKYGLGNKDVSENIEKDVSGTKDENVSENIEKDLSSNKGENGSENTEKSVFGAENNEKPIDPIAAQDKKASSNDENIHSLSDDSNKIDSDIDELHLLQKLHSDVVDTSTLESSDSESAIAISDTLSSSDNKKQNSDVISIENSSYSESERDPQIEFELVSNSESKVVPKSVDIQNETECSVAGVEKKLKKSNNDEYNESVEDILLASSDDDEGEGDKEKAKTDDPTSTTEENIDHSNTQVICTNEEHNKHVINRDITNACSIDSTGSNNKNNGNFVENIEITSVSSTENVDDDIAKPDMANNNCIDDVSGENESSQDEVTVVFADKTDVGQDIVSNSEFCIENGTNVDNIVTTTEKLNNNIEVETQSGDTSGMVSGEPDITMEGDTCNKVFKDTTLDAKDGNNVKSDATSAPESVSSVEPMDVDVNTDKTSV